MTATNPFSNSRVDTPFQSHSDLKEIFSEEFERLKSLITEINNDKENYQSQGAIVIGEPGTGKTHLMMRLAKDRLEHNRLLFIRQPNNLNSILFHIYSRVLESFVEKVPNSTYSQLEHLVATSFYHIIQETFANSRNSGGIFDYFRKVTDKDRFLLKVLSENPLNIYKKLGEEGARNKREYWQRIEVILENWWKRHYGDAGYSSAILKGIIKFCSYSDPNKKKLVGKWLSGNELEEYEAKSIGLKSWKEEGSKEAFSLDAMRVFGKLSMMDEPLIIIFDQLEGLGLEYNKPLLQSFGDAIKELFTHVPNSLIILNLFENRWEYFKEFFDNSVIGRLSQCQIILNKPINEQLKKILVLKGKAHEVDIEKLFSDEDVQDILNQDSIREVLNRASHYYRFRTQGVPLPAVRKVKSFEDDVKDQLTSIKNQLNVSNFESEVFGVLKTILSEIEGLKQNVVGKMAKVPVESSQQSHKKSTKLPSPVVLEDKSPLVSSMIIDYIDRERALLEQDYDKIVVISDSDDIGKVLAVTEAFNSRLKNIEIDRLKLGKRKLPEHYLIKTRAQSFVVGFVHSSEMGFPARIKNFNELVIKYPNIHFTLFRDVRETTIKGKVGRAEIEKLKKSANGYFIYMDKDDRINFEVIYKLIVDIQNRDFEVGLEIAMKTLVSLMSHHWLIKMFK
jgi:Cdc6-like AAA superfamily ATPase